MLLREIDSRSVNKDGSTIPAVWSAMRATDSEAGALYVLQHKYVIDNIINQLCSQIPAGAQITSIEFHGCTTRDMCALCFTNMNIIQYLCNNTNPYDERQFSFLRYLKHRLSNLGRLAEDCSAKMFISSIEALGNNLNFQAPALTDGEGENFLYQFRVQPPPPVRRPLTIVRRTDSSAGVASSGAGSSAE